MNEDVRAISVRNYWAWAIVYAGKNPENRSNGALGWRHRGLTLIQTGAKLDAALNACLWWDAEFKAHLEVPADDPRQTALAQLARSVHCASAESQRALAVRSAVIGVGELVDIHREEAGCCPPWGEGVHWSLDRKLRTNWTAHLVWRNVRPVWPPIDCKGKLGLWRPPSDVVAAALEAVAA